MPRRYTLTKAEFQIILGVMRSEGIPGMERFSLEAGGAVSEGDRDSLISKKLLVPDEDGLYKLDTTVGYVFSKIMQSDEYINGSILFIDGEQRQLNLYFVADAFEVMYCPNPGEVECTWLATIQPAIGAVIHYLKESAQPGREAAKDPPMSYDGANRYMSDVLSKAKEKKISDAQGVFYFTLRNTDNNQIVREYTYLTCANGKLYSAKKDANGLSFENMPIEQLLLPLSRDVLSIHREKIMEVSDE